MNVSTHRKWFAELNGRMREFSDILSLASVLPEAALLPSGDLWVHADAGPRPWWHRLLGAERWIVQYFWIEWEGSRARLTFYDEDGAEYGVTDPKGFDDPGEEAAFIAIHPDESTQPLLLKERALEAAREFLLSLQTPDWLTYKYAR